MGRRERREGGGRGEGGGMKAREGREKGGSVGKRWDGERLGSFSSDKHSTFTRSRRVWIGREVL